MRTGGSTALESALKRTRLWVLAALVGATLMCWAWIVPMARDMYGPMNGPSAWMRGETWDLGRVLLLFGMWSVMMAGMMLPSAAPTLLLYATVVRSHESERASARTYAFAAGYLLAWVAFSAAATALQRALSALLLLSPMMELRSRVLSGALLLAAGIYQLTPTKRSCLESCRSPAAFIPRHWRPGNAGAFHMGLIHGGYCLGCCWALMLLLFVGGVMNIYVIAAITLFVLLEKTAPLGAQGGRLSGGLLMALGLSMLLTR
jgi:predicted metal-binding membrane protein